jgi:arylsulfatase A-like enzyme
MSVPHADETVARRPNVVLIVADDLGFSDLGCYGGEIDTPALDRLGTDGVRFSQFYNTARCSPSRASLLTGLHPHQTGVGILTQDDRPVGYPGSLNGRCRTLAEVLAAEGYATCLSGKWHLCSDVWNANGSWPTRRGFQRFFGTLTGCGSYYWPGTLMRGEQSAEHEPLGRDFYYTDAISIEATQFVRRHLHDAPAQPFFLYLAYTAPHWPLHAHDEDIGKYDDSFTAGWDVLRERRMDRLRREGLLSPQARLSERDPTQPPWDDADDKPWQLRRMQTYAAQVDRMDRGIAGVVEALEEGGALDDTIILFLSDNGASCETLPLGDLASFSRRRDILRLTTRDGRPVRIGNLPGLMPGGEDTYASYGQAWANLSNTPFRYYKRWVHEGGIATPLIVHWPRGGLHAGEIIHDPFQLVDVMPTIIEAAGVEPVACVANRDVLPLEGRSMLAAMRGDSPPEATLYWEHTGNRAVRRGRWKLVCEWGRPWELYDLAEDRSELHDLAMERVDVVDELAEAFDAWATHVGVIPWEQTVESYVKRGATAREAAG